MDVIKEETKVDPALAWSKSNKVKRMNILEYNKYIFNNSTIADFYIEQKLSETLCFGTQ